jgi:hypothetical protein
LKGGTSAVADDEGQGHQLDRQAAAPKLQFWETGAQMPRNLESLKHWGGYDADSGTILEYELFP